MDFVPQKSKNQLYRGIYDNLSNLRAQGWTRFCTKSPPKPYNSQMLSHLLRRGLAPYKNKETESFTNASIHQDSASLFLHGLMPNTKKSARRGSNPKMAILWISFIYRNLFIYRHCGNLCNNCKFHKNRDFRIKCNTKCNTNATQNSPRNNSKTDE